MDSAEDLNDAGIIYAVMSLRRVPVPEGLHRTHSVLADCLPEDDSLPAVIPAERPRGCRDALRADGGGVPVPGGHGARSLHGRREGAVPEHRDPRVQGAGRERRLVTAAPRTA
ncbi:hypothetical protein GCM10010104_40560 [Streptomyces indiaensis]|uniref:Uncharacterized protein n=1 Tax=Streptomyces indiaensis TaxID=284033 RepID=A0ABN3DST9_9ACTN